MPKKRAYADDPQKARLFNIYRNMRQCSRNPNNRTYQVTVKHGIEPRCDWDSFNDFYTWVLNTLGPEPFTGARLVRKDQLKPWTRRNLEWNTHQEQGYRLVSTHKIRYRGRTQALSQWCHELGLSTWTIRQRLARGITKPQQLLYTGNLREYHATNS